MCGTDLTQMLNEGLRLATEGPRNTGVSWQLKAEEEHPLHHPAFPPQPPLCSRPSTAAHLSQDE